MSIEHLISTYGYAAIGIGTFFEGETILVMGGFAAHLGYLELKRVILFALLGTLFGDQLYFYIGRVKGKEFLENRPAWKTRAEKVFVLMERHQLWLILGFRFFYGLRTVTPLLIGASKISPLRFLNNEYCWCICLGSCYWNHGLSVRTINGNYAWRNKKI